MVALVMLNYVVVYCYIIEQCRFVDKQKVLLSTCKHKSCTLIVNKTVLEIEVDQHCTQNKANNMTITMFFPNCVSWNPWQNNKCLHQTNKSIFNGLTRNFDFQRIIEGKSKLYLLWQQWIYSFVKYLWNV